jgi:hypothetical protein
LLLLGVLNAEELSLLNGGFRPSEAHLLPGIEEVWSSIQSNSTRNTDSYSLASLEIDLLDNMRAFMQKSPKASSNRPTSTGKLVEKMKCEGAIVSILLFLQVYALRVNEGSSFFQFCVEF